MNREKPSNIILMAEDNEDDYFLASEAFRQHCPLSKLSWVKDGEELMDYLLQRNGYEQAQPPGIILLDLNMPKKDGREALLEIKAHPKLKRIPIVALTSSNDKEDIFFAYTNGVNSFIRKPVGFGEFVDFMKVCYEHNLDLIRLPGETNFIS